MMVQQLKEDQAGKSEEELSECFRIFDKYDTQYHQKDKRKPHMLLLQDFMLRWG